MLREGLPRVRGVHGDFLGRIREGLLEKQHLILVSEVGGHNFPNIIKLEYTKLIIAHPEFRSLTKDSKSFFLLLHRHTSKIKFLGKR